MFDELAVTVDTPFLLRAFARWQGVGWVMLLVGISLAVRGEGP